MSDKVFRWYIDGTIATAKTEVGGTYRLVDEHNPIEVYLGCRVAGKGSVPTTIDITADGVSIFPTYKPALLNNMTNHVYTTVPQNILRKGAILALDILGTTNELSCRDLTVELKTK